MTTDTKPQPKPEPAPQKQTRKPSSRDEMAFDEAPKPKK